MGLPRYGLVYFYVGAHGHVETPEREESETDLTKGLHKTTKTVTSWVVSAITVRQCRRRDRAKAAAVRAPQSTRTVYPHFATQANCSYKIKYLIRIADETSLSKFVLEAAQA